MGAAVAKAKTKAQAKTKSNVITWECERQSPQGLVINERLKEKLTELTEDCRDLFSEFHQLEREVRQTAPETAVAAVIHRVHNRYADIGQCEV